MPDPTPKSPARRARGRQSAVVPRGTTIATPEPVDAWLVTTKIDWTDFWASPVAGHVVSSDMAGLRNLFTMRDRQERFWRAGMKRPTSLGSTGQLVVHPLIKAAMELEGKIQSLGDRYGANPRARLALTVGLGDAARSVADLTNEELIAGDVEPVELYPLDRPTG